MPIAAIRDGWPSYSGKDYRSCHCAGAVAHSSAALDLAVRRPSTGGNPYRKIEASVGQACSYAATGASPVCEVAKGDEAVVSNKKSHWPFIFGPQDTR